MALRNILLEGELQLLKRSRPVTEFNERLHILLDDMRDTLIHAGGVGLAAPQVGILRRAVLVFETNVPEGEEERLLELVNPEIVSSSGEQTGLEGCLSLPGYWGEVTRPMKVKVKAQDRSGNQFEVEDEGMVARCFCHEIDHLDGHMFDELCDKLYTMEEVEKMFQDAAEEGRKELEAKEAE